MAREKAEEISRSLPAQAEPTLKETLHDMRERAQKEAKEELERGETARTTTTINFDSDFANLTTYERRHLGEVWLKMRDLAKKMEAA